MIRNNIKKLREEMGSTQKQLADYLNVTRSTYSYYESGKNFPSIQSLIKLSKIFGVSCDYILTGKTNSANPQYIGDIINESTKKERKILCYFRTLPAGMQDKVLDILKTFIKKFYLKIIIHCKRYRVSHSIPSKLYAHLISQKF